MRFLLVRIFCEFELSVFAVLITSAYYDESVPVQYHNSSSSSLHTTSPIIRRPVFSQIMQKRPMGNKGYVLLGPVP